MTTRRVLAIIIALALILGVAVCLTGCTSTEPNEFELVESEIGGLVVIALHENFLEGYTFNQYVLYDPETLVMYVMITKPKAMTMSALYNVDGTPKLYNPDR